MSHLVYLVLSLAVGGVMGWYAGPKSPFYALGRPLGHWAARMRQHYTTSRKAKRFERILRAQVDERLRIRSRDSSETFTIRLSDTELLWPASLRSSDPRIGTPITFHESEPDVILSLPEIREAVVAHDLALKQAQARLSPVDTTTPLESTELDLV